MSLNRFTYSFGTIRDTLVDGYYLWILFTVSGGSTKLMKVDANNPSVIYYELTLTIADALKLKISGNYIFVLAKDNNYIAVRITRTNPIGTSAYYAKPTVETEIPVDFVISDWIYILMPGAISGEYAKIHKFATSNVAFQETIELNLGGNFLRNASAIDIDTSTETLYIVTNEDPLELAKLLYNTGWILTTWSIE